MNREVNTIGSKSNDLEITNMVVDIKSEIEKLGSRYKISSERRQF